MMTRRYESAELQRYLEAEVVPEKDETKRINDVLKEDLDKLFQFIKKYDSRLYQQVAHVGSYYQGLKVRRSDEFDYTLCIDIDAKWCVSNGSRDQCRVLDRSHQLYYGFEGYDLETERKAHTKPQDRGDGIPTNLHNTMDEKLEIVKKSRSLDYPGKDCFSISPNQEILRQFHDMSFSEDLVPRLVKLKLKGALKMALEQRNYFKGKFTSGFTAHGPALTLKYEHPDPKIQFPISIDIAPAVNTQLSFEQLGLTWPRPREVMCTPWPSVKLQRAVKAKGVMLVAKQNFFWFTSFVECEKELSKHADEDGGNRKQVHRLMKMFRERFWEKETKSLSSYMLKNAWFWACEKRPVKSDWEQDKMSIRVYDCINLLVKFLEKRNLPNYFNPEINLLADEDGIGNVAEVIKKFLRNPPALCISRA